MPFAENGGGVAALFDEFGESHFVRADADFGARAERAVNAEAVWIASGEEPATGSGADGLGDVEIAEDAALGREAIEVGSDETFRAEDADVGVALVVGEDDDDVGELRPTACSPETGLAAQQQRNHAQKDSMFKHDGPI